MADWVTPLDVSADLVLPVERSRPLVASSSSSSTFLEGSTADLPLSIPEDVDSQKDQALKGDRLDDELGLSPLRGTELSLAPLPSEFHDDLPDLPAPTDHDSGNGMDLDLDTDFGRRDISVGAGATTIAAITDDEAKEPNEQRLASVSPRKRRRPSGDAFLSGSRSPSKVGKGDTLASSEVVEKGDAGAHLPRDGADGQDEAEPPSEEKGEVQADDITGLPDRMELDKDSAGAEVEAVSNAPELGATLETEDETEMQDPALREILKKLAESRGDAEGDGDNEPAAPESLWNSPISDLPDLPTELPPSPVPKSPTPDMIVVQPLPTSSATATAITQVNKPSSPRASGSASTEPSEPTNTLATAESSTTAAKPANPPPSSKPKSSASKQAKPFWKPAPVGSPAKAKRIRLDKGKYKEAYPNEVDELESLSDGDGERLAEMTVDDVKSEKLANGKRRGTKSKAGEGAAQAGGTKRKRKDPTSITNGHASHVDKSSQRRPLTDVKLKQELLGKTVERQIGVCQRPRYTPWGKCCQCVAKAGGDSCRFRDFRLFKIDPKTTDIIGAGYFDSTEPLEETTPLPTEFNVPFGENQVSRTERTVAPMLLPVISRELRHAVNTKAVVRYVDAAVHRSVCDFCSSTIFGGFFCCKKCGRDYCLECERYFSDSLEAMRDSPWDLPDAARPRLLRCTNMFDSNGRVDSARPKQAFHVRTDLQAVTRFDVDTLQAHWYKLVEFVLDGENGVEERLRLLGLAEEELATQVAAWMEKHHPPQAQASRSNEDAPANGDIAALPGTESRRVDELAEYYTKRTHPTAHRIPDPAELEDRSLPFLFVDVDKLDNELFDKLWARGETMVVDNVGKRFKQIWTPDTFIERFGDEPCLVVECQSEVVKQMTVGKFFQVFKDSEDRSKKILKLKDWPSTHDFQSAYPDLYNDFCDSLPVPDFTRREGVLNLYAHFPPGPTKPDIGPKMYNAFAAKEDKGGHGSTRLHMDVADAVNIMLYASPREDDQPGCAVWDLFRAEDADKIRQFLTRKFSNKVFFTDPIHSQVFYLDAELRRELAEKYGVVSSRVYQYPGQAVFIPAGCAHQVCNLADCIKIALDFVSPHNVSRCEQLVNDFRKENYIKAWKDDVLQLHNVMWYAWLNSRETRQRWKDEAAQAKIDQQAEQERQAARAVHLAQLQNGHGDHQWPPISGSGAIPTSSLRDGVAGSGGLGSRASSPPVRTGWLSPAVSSVRDEPAPARSHHATPERETEPSGNAGRWAIEERNIDPRFVAGGDGDGVKEGEPAEGVSTLAEANHRESGVIDKSKQGEADAEGRVEADEPAKSGAIDKTTTVSELPKEGSSSTGEKDERAALIERILKATLAYVDPPPPMLQSTTPANGASGVAMGTSAPTANGVMNAGTDQRTGSVKSEPGVGGVKERKVAPLAYLIKRGMLPVEVGMRQVEDELRMMQEEGGLGEDEAADADMNGGGEVGGAEEVRMTMDLGLDLGPLGRKGEVQGEETVLSGEAGGGDNVEMRLEKHEVVDGGHDEGVIVAEGNEQDKHAVQDNQHMDEVRGEEYTQEDVTLAQLDLDLA